MFRDFIDCIRKGLVFCPHRRMQLPVLTCLNPPKKEELLRLLSVAFGDGIRRKKKFVMQHRDGITALIKIFQNPNKVPDTQWLLLLLAAVGGPEHELW